MAPARQNLRISHTDFHAHPGEIHAQLIYMAYRTGHLLVLRIFALPSSRSTTNHFLSIFLLDFIYILFSRSSLFSNIPPWPFSTTLLK